MADPLDGSGHQVRRCDASARAAGVNHIGEQPQPHHRAPDRAHPAPVGGEAAAGRLPPLRGEDPDHRGRPAQPARARPGRSGVPPLRPHPSQPLRDAIGNPRREAADARAWEEAKARQDAYQAQVRRAAQKQATKTKRGEALCFIYSGGPVAREANDYDDSVGPGPIQDVRARIFVGTRDQFQKLKHSDAGTQEEREQLLGLFTALAGAPPRGLSIRRFPSLAEPAAPAD